MNFEVSLTNIGESFKHTSLPLIILNSFLKSRHRFRPFIWRYLLKLRGNVEEYKRLCGKELNPAFRDIDDTITPYELHYLPAVQR